MALYRNTISFLPRCNYTVNSVYLLFYDKELWRCKYVHIPDVLGRVFIVDKLIITQNNTKTRPASEVKCVKSEKMLHVELLIC